MAPSTAGASTSTGASATARSPRASRRSSCCARTARARSRRTTGSSTSTPRLPTSIPAERGPGVPRSSRRAVGATLDANLRSAGRRRRPHRELLRVRGRARRTRCWARMLAKRPEGRGLREERDGGKDDRGSVRARAAQRERAAAGRLGVDAAGASSPACSPRRARRSRCINGASSGAHRRRDVLRGLRRARGSAMLERRHEPQRGDGARPRECKPQAPQTGWWWNPARGRARLLDRGAGQPPLLRRVPLRRRGRANWFVATGTTSLDGSLFTRRPAARARAAQTLGGAYQTDTPAQRRPVHARLHERVDRHDDLAGRHRARSSASTSCPTDSQPPPRANAPESGWWWNPAESGRGFFIEWQNGSADHRGLHVRRRGQSDLVHRGEPRRRLPSRTAGPGCSSPTARWRTATWGRRRSSSTRRRRRR